MVISVDISVGTEKILAEQASLRGQTVESYAAELYGRVSRAVEHSRRFSLHFGSKSQSPVFLMPAWTNFLRVPAPKYIDLAFTARSNYLVSRDRDLLDLMEPDSQLVQTFHRLGFEFKIVDPILMLTILRKG